MTAHCPRCGCQLTPSKQPLTRQQAAVLRYLREFSDARGYAPSFSEIADHCGYRSLSTVHEHLRTLERKGWIARRFNEERAITLVEDDTAALITSEVRA